MTRREGVVASLAAHQDELQELGVRSLFLFGPPLVGELRNPLDRPIS